MTKHFETCSKAAKVLCGKACDLRKKNLDVYRHWKKGVLVAQIFFAPLRIQVLWLALLLNLDRKTCTGVVFCPLRNLLTSQRIQNSHTSVRIFSEIDEKTPWAGEEPNHHPIKLASHRETIAENDGDFGYWCQNPLKTLHIGIFIVFRNSAKSFEVCKTFRKLENPMFALLRKQ